MDGAVQTTETVLKGELVYIPEIDATLTKEGYSADAKATGDAIKTLADTINGTTSGGNYIGNGSAEPITIDVGEVKPFVAVYNDDYFSFVTSKGAQATKLSDGTTSWVSDVTYLNGVLTIATTNEAFNKSGTGYSYYGI